MLGSQGRILTTHTGSLPRPPALTEMYARRADGEAIDEAALDTAAKAATRHVVARRLLPASMSAITGSSNARRSSFMSAAA